MKRGFILLMVLALAATLLAGCAIPGTPSLTPEETTPSSTTQPSSPSLSTGTIKVLVTDAPAYDVSKVDVTVSEVQVHKAGDDGESGQWRTLAIQEKNFNLLDLQNGLTLLLAEGEVESGKYTQLRMTVFKVLVDYDDVQGKEAEIPSGKLKFVRPFTLEDGGEITLVVDIDAAKSVVFTGATKDGEDKVLFKPVVKLQVVHEEEPSPQAPTATFDPTSGPVETMITVTGTGWVADDTINSVTVGGEAAAYTLTVKVDGNLEGTITVPDGLSPGDKDIVITGETSGEQTFLNTFEVIE